MNEINANLIEKIKKLLAKGNCGSVTAKESEEFLAKAKNIAISNGIDIARIKNKAEKDEMKRSDIRSGQRFPIAMRWTASILSNHFNVKVVYCGSRQDGRFVVLLGRESDVQIAEYVLEFLNNSFLSIWRTKAKELFLPVSSRDSFMIGLYKGLDAKLTNEARIAKEAKLSEIKAIEGENEAIEASSSYSLALINNEKVLDLFVKNSFNKLKKGTARTVTLSDENALNVGYKEGQKIQIKQGLGANQEMLN